MPTAYRRWFVNRLVQHFREQNGEADNTASIGENIQKIDDFITKLR